MAQRRRLNAISENLANVSTTRSDEGGPYRRLRTTFAEVQRRVSAAQTAQELRADLDLSHTRSGHMLPEQMDLFNETVSGVRAVISPDDSPPMMVYEPGHPDADENGFVKYPNINPVTEMVDLISATRAYEANVTAVKSFKEMARKALEI
jgi:flagellar basal-body rod protein FlgC